LAISEHGLKEDEITQHTLEGYTLASYFCKNEHEGGGVAIYSSTTKLQQTPFKWVTQKNIEKPLEITGVELTGEKKKIVIIALYRSPSGNLQELCVTLIGILEQLAQKDQYIILQEIST
jgi:hypothetical protein